MFRTNIYFVSLNFVLCFSITYAKIPSYIHPCTELTDECLTKATQDAIPGFVKGIPELNVPVLDPLVMNENVSIELPGGLKLEFINGKVIGFRTCLVDKVSTHRKIKQIDFNFHCNLTIKGIYALRGRFLLFNLDTDGSAKIKINNLGMRLDVHEEFVKNDKDEVHYSFPSYKFTTDYGDSRHLNLTNLFKSSPELSASLLQFINANSRALAQDFGGPIVEFAVGYSMKVIGKFFDAFPYNELVYAPLPDNAFS